MPFQYFSKLLSNNDPVIVLPYGGYITDSKIIANARVVEDKGVRKKANDGLIKNIINSYKRFETDEIKGAKVIATIGDRIIEVHSDSEGYITLQHPHYQNFAKEEATKWIPCHYQLLSEGEIYSVTDEVMLPSKNASYGIISDIDETVISTGLESKFKWRVLASTFLKKSEDRTPINHANTFYQILQKGDNGERDNPFFYISNSPWNLHEYLQEFLIHHDFPKGSLILRDIGFRNRKAKAFIEDNKFVKIAQILRSYPNMEFILIGDAVEIDTDIYIEIARQFPNQVKTIFIHPAKEGDKIERVSSLIEKNANIHVELIESAEQAIHLAQNHGLIP